MFFCKKNINSILWVLHWNSGQIIPLAQKLGFPSSSVVKEICLQCKKPQFDSWRRDRLSTPLFLGFPCGLVGKESTCNAGDQGLIPGLGRSPGEGKGYPLQYSGLENSMDGIVHGVSKSQTWLSDFHFHLWSLWPCVGVCVFEAAVMSLLPFFTAFFFFGS